MTEKILLLASDVFTIQFRWTGARSRAVRGPSTGGYYGVLVISLKKKKKWPQGGYRQNTPLGIVLMVILQKIFMWFATIHKINSHSKEWTECFNKM